MCKVSFWILGTYCELVSSSTCANCIALCVKFQSRYSAWRPWRSRWPPAQMTSGQWPPNHIPPPPCSDPLIISSLPLKWKMFCSPIWCLWVFLLAFCAEVLLILFTLLIPCPFLLNLSLTKVWNIFSVLKRSLYFHPFHSGMRRWRSWKLCQNSRWVMSSSDR